MREYTIDQLAAETGVPSRTIRFYQAKGVLPAPERSGRQAFYGPGHVERLRLIAELQDRGLRLQAIRDLFDLESKGALSVEQWLGLGEQLQAPWSEDAPQLLREDELAASIGERPPGFLGAVLRSGLVERQEGGMYLVHSPELLRITLRLVDAGIAIDTVRAAEDAIRRRMQRAAADLVALFADEAETSLSEGPDRLGRTLEALRDVAPDAVRLIFGQEIERALANLLERGAGALKRARRR